MILQVAVAHTADTSTVTDTLRMVPSGGSRTDADTLSELMVGRGAFTVTCVCPPALTLSILDQQSDVVCPHGQSHRGLHPDGMPEHSGPLVGENFAVGIAGTRAVQLRIGNTRRRHSRHGLIRSCIGDWRPARGRRVRTNHDLI